MHRVMMVMMHKPPSMQPLQYNQFRQHQAFENGGRQGSNGNPAKKQKQMFANSFMSVMTTKYGRLSAITKSDGTAYITNHNAATPSGRKRLISVGNAAAEAAGTTANKLIKELLSNFEKGMTAEPAAAYLKKQMK